MGAFMVVVLKMSAEDAWDTFMPYHNILKPFRDASYGDCYYDCTVFHCLKGLELAVMHGWYNFRTFDPAEYEYYEKVPNGDLNWTIPGKFISFMGPVDTKYNRRGNCPEDYIQIFKHLGVSHVIRLNDIKYDRNRFLKHGIKHTDMYFIDGSTPSDKIVNNFLKICEEEPGSIAVHCKAGLGRTGSLIGCYAMKHFQFPAAFFIGWIRIARPGSVLGP
jgi:cell division cycle 14